MQRQIPIIIMLDFFEDLLCAKHSAECSEAFFPVSSLILQREVPVPSLTNGAQRGQWPAQGHTARKRQQQALNSGTLSQGLSIFLTHMRGIICSWVLKDVLCHGRSYAFRIASGGIRASAFTAVPQRTVTLLVAGLSG